MGHSKNTFDRDGAREAKAELAALVRELVAHRIQAQGLSTPGIAVGLSPQMDGGFVVAVRYRLGVPTARMVARRVQEIAGPQVDVRRTGRIRPLRATGPRPPVITTQSVGETGRARPLRPGVSIGHVHVTAGTLGAFVDVGGARHVLSCYHVLAGSPSAHPGDVVVQPGVADGGRDPQDRIGTLAAVVHLDPATVGHADAAVARLDEGIAVDLTYPVGRITTTAELVGDEPVAKIGRTTGVTRGRISAIELDDVVVGYGPELGDLRFDDQIEIEGVGGQPFSRGGDSGALVYRDDGVAVGLLFAGSETGGQNGQGLTYANPIDAVLQSLGAELAT
jgi:hypothetical protein